MRLVVALALVLSVASCAPQPEAKELHQIPLHVKPSIRKVAEPWKPGDFQKGVQIYWHYVASDADVKNKIDKMLDYVVGLDANSVGITFPIDTDGATPTRVYADPETPSPHQLGIIINEAKKRELRVLIRPLIYEANIVAENPNAWRGSIKIADIDQWFVSYDQFIMQYVPVAIQYKADEFVAGTELTSLQTHTANWQQLIQQVSGAGYTGAISYSMNFVGGLNNAFGVLGVDAYPPVQVGDDASVDQLSGAIAGWMVGTYPPDVRVRLTVQEAGIPALSGMYPHPWRWGTDPTQPLNFTVQANWFSAMCSATHAAGLQGVYYWAFDTNIDFATANPDTDYSGSFFRRPAALSIYHCFSTP